MLFQLRLVFTFLFIVFSLANICAQNTSISIDAVVDIATQEIDITQQITYTNTSDSTLTEIYLQDWSNSFENNQTPLAERLAEEFSTKFYFSNPEELGFTKVFSITNQEQPLTYSRLDKQADIIKVVLNTPLAPNQSCILNLDYSIKLPSDTFTRYGYTKNNTANLRYWYITPAVYDGKWQYYSNKNLDDLYTPLADISINITCPNNYQVTTDLNLVDTITKDNTKTVSFAGKQRANVRLFLDTLPKFKTIQTDFFNIKTDINGDKLNGPQKAIIVDRITDFITKNIGKYPHETLLVTEIDSKKNPVYGLNQLPSFIRPFPDAFQYEIKLLKTTLNNYLEETLQLNPRTDYWLYDALQVYFLMKYVKMFYPDMKLFGGLSKVWGLRAFHGADLDYNTQYKIGYLQMARTNRSQPLTMVKDSLLKFNANIANKYKAGIGLQYLDDFINANTVEETIKEFVSNNTLKPSTTKDFETLLKSKTDKNLDWFFTDYLNTRNKIDYKLKDVKVTNDSVSFTVKNKRNNTMPVALFTLNKDSVTSKAWLTNISDEKRYTIPRNDTKSLVLNHDEKAPEINLRDNSKNLKGFFGNSKPLQFRLFQDFEDPKYNQIFLMPIIQFNNIYDGLTLGARLYNKTVLRRTFLYRISPQYATKSKTLTGGASFFKTHYFDDRNLNALSYGIRGSYRSFAEDRFARVISPSMNFNFRDHKDLRSNKRQSLNVRYLNIHRDRAPLNQDADEDTTTETEEAPNYSVFNIRYANTDVNLVTTKNISTDFQIADKFGKLSLNYYYRKLFKSSRQFNFRFFAGAFLYNRTSTDSDYFSFALDRPTDYLFDYNYLGRSEDSGLFSQQLIIAEGGFKSKLNTPYANQWMTTANVGTSIWRWFQVYGDVGLVKNKYQSAKFVYDSGLRINLVQDYFEIYLPMYSNLGWEIAQPNYDQKIRFIFTIDPKSLLGIFRRRWY